MNVTFTECQKSKGDKCEKMKKLATQKKKAGGSFLQAILKMIKDLPNWTLFFYVGSFYNGLREASHLYAIFLQNNRDSVLASN